MKKTVLAAAILAGAALVSPASAETIVFGNLTSDHCTGTCGPQTGGFGLITVTDNDLGTGGAVGTLKFTIQLINGNTFAAGGQDVVFGFDLAGNPTITYSVLPNSLPNTRAWTIPNVGAGNTQAAGSLHADGFGNVEYGVEMTGSGTSGNPPNFVTFSISAVNLDWTDLQTIMVADIFSGTTGKTGFVDFTGNLSVNPQCTGACAVPAPIVGAGIPGLIASLGTLVVLARRRRRLA